MLKKIKELSASYAAEVTDIRRQIHAYPELAFDEVKTSQLVQDKLAEFGIPFQENVAKTGVVGLIEGKNPESRVTALRADMDALPILEDNDLPFKSTRDGLMHACGHDVHTSCLIGAAKVLKELSGEFEGTVKLIFQPSEEKLPGGASVMIKEGVLENPTPNSIIGQHVSPELEVGQVGFCPGLSMASADEVYLRVRGQGGHAAMPQACIDPILVSAHIITALQHVVSRRSHPSTPCVLSFGKIVGGAVNNVIPMEVNLEGTFRAMNESWRFQAHDIIKETAENTAKAFGACCDVDIRVGYPFLINDVELTNHCSKLAEAYMGKENVVDMEMRMGAEDFAYYSQIARGCFYRLGTGNSEKGWKSSVHTPTFMVDERAIEIGMGMMAWLAVNGIGSEA